MDGLVQLRTRTYGAQPLRTRVLLALDAVLDASNCFGHGGQIEKVGTTSTILSRTRSALMSEMTVILQMLG